MDSRRSATISIPLLFLFLAGAAGLGAQAMFESTKLDDASTRGEAILRIDRTGRYSVLAQGGLKPRVQLVDRMSGLLVEGQGRADAFLEPGDYKVRVTKGAGEHVSLALRSFRATNAIAGKAGFPLLADDGSPELGTLGDFETRSYWVQVGADGSLVVEMKGRSLAGAVLWRDGVWETGSKALVREYAPAAAHPMGFLEYSARVEPGTYLLTCYGGPRRTWGDDSAEETFSIRRGSIYLGASGSTRVKFDATGLASFTISGATSLVQLEAANNRGYRLTVSSASLGRSRLDAYSSAAMDEKASSYRLSVRCPGGARQWVSLQGPPGESVELRWLQTAGYQSWRPGLSRLLLDYSGGRGGPYVVSALADFASGDAIDLTALFLHVPVSGTAGEVLDTDALPLGPDSPLRRRVNNLSPSSFLVSVGTGGAYTILEKSDAVSAKYSFRLLEDLMQNAYGKPLEAVAGAKVPLLAKTYLVTLTPLKQGLLDFWLGSDESVGSDPLGSGEAASPRTSLFYPSWDGSPPAYFVFSLPAAQVSVDARRLPVKLSEPLSVPVSAGKSVKLPILLDADSLLYALGDSVSLAVDGTLISFDRVVPKGRHDLELRSSSNAAMRVTVGARAALPDYTGPEPSLVDPATLYPSFSEGKPAWLDFERGQSVLYWLKVETPGPYRVETEGRLRMRLEIRSLLHPSLFTAEANGDGGNAAVTAYLKPGSYLVRAQTMGASKGRAGLVLTRPGLAQAGSLSGPGILRTSVPEGDFLAATLSLDRESAWELDCLGLSQSFPWRLEDSEGWPLGAPIAEGSFADRLSPGLYRYLSYPSEIATDRLVRLYDRDESAGLAPDPRARSLELHLGQSMKKLWIEEAGRPEDRFAIVSPTALRAALLVGEGMTWRLFGPAGVQLASGSGNAEVELQRGRNELRVSSLEVDNLKEYDVGIAPLELYEGAYSGLDSNGSLVVSIGRPGYYELWSYGRTEIEGQLLDGDGNNLLASSERIADDWNFRLVVELEPGRYLLRCAPPGGSLDTAGQGSSGPDEGENTVAGAYEGGEDDEGSPAAEMTEPSPDSGPPIAALAGAGLLQQGSVIVSLVPRDILDQKAQTGVFSLPVKLGAEVARLDFRAGAPGIYRFGADSPNPTSLALYREGKQIATGSGSLLIPLTAGSVCSVRAWHPGGENSLLTFSGSLEKTAELSPGAPGASGGPEGGELRTAPAEAIAHIVSGRQASMLIEGERELLLSSGWGEAFEPLPDGPVAGGDFWLASADGRPLGALTLAEFRLADGSPAGFELGARPQSFLAAVPSGKIGLIRAGQTPGDVGICASPLSAYKPGRVDWNQEGPGAPLALIGLREGSYQGLVWNTDPAADKLVRRSSVGLRLYPLTAPKSLAPGGRAAFTLAPATAVTVNLGAAGQSARVSLEEGMTAFGWAAGKNAGPEGSVSALGGAATGSLEASGASLTVVNTGSSPALCSIALGPSSERPSVGVQQSYESYLPAARAMSFSITAPAGSTLWIDGRLAYCRFFREDGAILLPDEADSPFAGLVTLPGGKGRLELSAEAGLLKLCVAGPAGFGAAYVGREPTTKLLSFPTGGAASAVVSLLPGSQSWSLAATAGSILRLRAEGSGLLALYDASGKLLGLDRGDSGQTILQRLPAGSCQAYLRPWAGLRRQGSLRLETLAPEAAPEGRGESLLAAPFETRLFSFEVKAEGLVGAGLAAGSENLKVSLYDERFTLLSPGPLFIGKLKVGRYYLLVENGETTQRYATLLYGLSGSLGATPESVIKEYSGE